MVLQGESKIFILGAGSSVEYGLPVWVELRELLREQINNDWENKYKFKSEIIEWLGKVDENSGYKTIDECITKESDSDEYFDIGADIENQIFLIFSEIFQEKYKEQRTGWIGKLNNKIIDDESNRLLNSIYFINYNYDSVLYKNILSFDHLTQKRRAWISADRIEALEGKTIDCFCPHGTLFEKDAGLERLNVASKTNKTNRATHDAISCFDSKEYVLKNRFPVDSYELYILGLGMGLETNLNNIVFPGEVSMVHITIRNNDRREEIVSYLMKKYSLTENSIVVYSDCVELINKSI